MIYVFLQTKLLATADYIVVKAGDLFGICYEGESDKPIKYLDKSEVNMIYFTNINNNNIPFKQPPIFPTQLEFIGI